MLRSKHKIFITVLALMTGHFIWATSFVPVSHKLLIEESDAVLRGVYRGKNYKRLADGNVVTEHIFKVVSSAGLKNSKIVNPQEFKVLSPGGEWQGVTYKVHGSPEFVEGEESILLLKQDDYGMWIQGLKSGTFSLKQSDNQLWIKSNVFPNHPEYGTISYSEFDGLLKQKYHRGLSFNKSDTYINKTIQTTSTSNIDQGRSIASDESIEQEETDSTQGSRNKLGIIGLLLVLTSLGVYYSFKATREK